MKIPGLFYSENLDVHTHSPYSACCEDITFENLKSKAQEKNIIYAVTDHSTHLYFPKELAWSMLREDFKELWNKHRETGRQTIEKYIETVRNAGALTGIELDIYSDGTLVFEEDYFRELDIVLGGIHFLPSLESKMPAKNIVSEFKRLTAAILSSGKIDVLTHPLRILAYNRVPFEDDLICWVVENCKECGVAVEINSHYKFPDIDLKMTAEANRNRVRVVKASDAHRLSEFGNFSYHEDILSRCAETVTEKKQLLKAG
jgi:histidinol phosphatase-like PHP family hydrolase